MSKTLAPSQSVTSRDPKGQKFVSIVETAYNKADLTDEEAQQVNNTLGLSRLITQFIAENRFPHKYKDEEVESGFGYPEGFRIKSVASQLKLLQEYFGPALDKGADLSIVQQPLPKHAEGYYAIPRWKLIAPTYGEALAKLFAAIRTQRWLYDHPSPHSEYFQKDQRTASFMKTIETQQSGQDVLIVAAQFGMRHRGRSARRARHIFLSNEFGLDTFAVGCMILTHPHRFQDNNDLSVKCLGDNAGQSPEDGKLTGMPTYSYERSSHMINFGFYASFIPSASTGGASAFVSLA
jgi:hypothetical protein